jgi:Tfp pilus assembly PilM family ATPase
MLHSETILGLALGDRRVQAVAIRHEGSKKTLLAIDEWNNTLPFRSETNGAGLARFRENLSEYLTTHKLAPDKVSVTVDSGQVFIATLPFEEGISRLERNNQVRWELSQYFPDIDTGAFVTDVQPLTDNKIDKWVKAISVSLPRRHTDAIGSLMGQMGLHLHIVDVDHFSADHALRYNYRDTGKKYMGLIGIKENRLDISLLRNGVLESYSYRVVSSNTEIVEHVGAIARETVGLYSLCAYGTFLDIDLLVQIRRASTLLVEALNPLRHVGISDTLILADHLSVPSYRFAAAVGVALRQD